ncbi:MAG: GspH/FimT family pseudopilin [Massilia sp.]
MLAMRRRSGFTMIELMIVLVIAAILMLLASPEMRSLLQRLRLESAVADMAGAIDLARTQAIARGSRVQLVPLEPGGSDWRQGWVVFIDTDNNRRPGPGEEVIASHGPLAQGIVVTFTFTGNSRPYYIAYNGAGRSCSDTSSLAARMGTLSFHQDRQIRRIRINMLGRARVCNPDRDAEGCSGD